MSLEDECSCSCGGECSDLDSFVDEYPAKEKVNDNLDKALKNFDEGFEEYRKGFQKEIQKTPNKFYSFLKNLVDYFKT